MIGNALEKVFVGGLVAAIYLTVVLPFLPMLLLLSAVGIAIGATDLRTCIGACKAWLRLEFLGHELGRNL